MDKSLFLGQFASIPSNFVHSLLSHPEGHVVVKTSWRQPTNSSRPPPQSGSIKKLKVHPQGESFVNLTKTLKIDGFRDFQLIPSPGEARGWGVVEAPHYSKEGLGWLR